MSCRPPGGAYSYARPPGYFALLSPAQSPITTRRSMPAEPSWSPKTQCRLNVVFTDSRDNDHATDDEIVQINSRSSSAATLGSALRDRGSESFLRPASASPEPTSPLFFNSKRRNTVFDSHTALRSQIPKKLSLSPLSWSLPRVKAKPKDDVQNVLSPNRMVIVFEPARCGSDVQIILDGRVALSRAPLQQVVGSPAISDGWHEWRVKISSFKFYGNTPSSLLIGLCRICTRLDDDRGVLVTSIEDCACWTVNLVMSQSAASSGAGKFQSHLPVYGHIGRNRDTFSVQVDSFNRLLILTNERTKECLTTRVDEMWRETSASANDEHVFSGLTWEKSEVRPYFFFMDDLVQIEFVNDK